MGAEPNGATPACRRNARFRRPPAMRPKQANLIRWSFAMAEADQGLEIHVEVDEDNMIGLSFIAAGLATSVALTVEEADELMLALQQAIGAVEDDD